MRNNMIKYFGVAAVALGLAASVQAVTINGGISFDGAYTPQNSSSIAVSDLSLATQIAFGATTVTSTSGSFGLIPNNTAVTLFTPLVINPATLPATPLWTVTDGVDTFTLTLTSMSVGAVNGVYPNVQSLQIFGSGIFSYSGPAGLDNSYGTWVGTFNAGGATFSWSSSSVATGDRVPDGGTTAMLLGTALSALALIRRKL